VQILILEFDSAVLEEFPFYVTFQYLMKLAIIFCLNIVLFSIIGASFLICK